MWWASKPSRCGRRASLCRRSPGKAVGGQRNCCGATRNINRLQRSNWPRRYPRRLGRVVTWREGVKSSALAIRGGACPARTSRLLAERGAPGTMAADGMAHGEAEPTDIGSTPPASPNDKTWSNSPSTGGSLNATTRNSNRNSAWATSKAVAGEDSTTTPRSVSPLRLPRRERSLFPPSPRAGKLELPVPGSRRFHPRGCPRVTPTA